MTPALLTIALLAVTGYPFAKRRIGESLLIGAGIVPALLLVIPWTRIALVTACAAAFALGWFVVKRDEFAQRDRPFVLDLVTLVGVCGYALYATLAPVAEFDFIIDWGLKARAYFEAGHFDLAFLRNAFHQIVHADYPTLLPLTFDVFAIVRGAWDDRWIGLLYVAFAASMLLIIHREALRDTASPWRASFITLAMLPFCASPWIGLGDGPLAAYFLAALLLVRRGEHGFAGVMLGLAASTKNEGYTMIVAVALALVATKKTRDVWRLWPAVAIALPWLVVRKLTGLETDLAQGSVGARIAEHLAHPGELLSSLARYPVGKPLFWLAIVAGFALAARTLVRRDLAVLVAVALQFLFYIGAYLASPHGLDWHVHWSWERLVSHLTPALTFVILTALLDNRDQLYQITSTSIWPRRSPSISTTPLPSTRSSTAPSASPSPPAACSRAISFPPSASSPSSCA